MLTAYWRAFHRVERRRDLYLRAIATDNPVLIEHARELLRDACRLTNALANRSQWCQR